MHHLLERQVKKYLGASALAAPEWKAFLESVSDAYEGFDEDRALLDRSLDISSKEFFETNRQLKETMAKVEEQAQSLALQVADRTKDLNDRIEELVEANAKSEALLQSIGEGVIAADQEGKVIVANKVATSLLGVPTGALIGKLFIRETYLIDEQGNMVSDKDRPMTQALSSGKSVTVNSYAFVRKDGSSFPASVTATPVVLKGKPIGAMSVFRDITKEKEIEKLRVDFLSLASHQLRTPLSGTKWLIETIQRGTLGKLNSRQKSYLDNLYQVNERMIKLVSDMLGVLLLESGNASVERKESLVSRMCEEAIFMMEPAAKSSRVSLIGAFKGAKTLSVVSDQRMILGILECFISNAINYSKSGKKVTLDAMEESKSIVFSVKDSGIGIPQAEQKKVFDRFYRASNAKEFKPNGTGLGLYAALLMARRIGADISFESKMGKGSTFYLRVPKVGG